MLVDPRAANASVLELVDRHVCKAFRFFLCPSDGCFHLFFPLQAGNAFDKPFHAVCAGLLHPICHMTIYIQRKCCGVVA